MAGAVIGALRVVLGADTAAFEDAMESAADRLKGVGKTMQSVGKSISLSLSAPLAGFGMLALQTAGDFEASMNRLRAATGATASELAAMEALARDLGKSTSKSASEVADAMEMLAKNGLSARQILDGAAEAAIMLSEATGGDLAAAADVATDVMASFGLQASEMKGVIDGITGVTLQSKFDFNDYALALAQAGGAVGSLGVSFEDFNATISATSNLFASGSDAGTSFKTFVQRLVPASKEAAGTMKELGLEFFNADGSMKSMAAIAENLRTSLGGLSEEARNDALTTIFGSDAIRTGVGLMNQGAEGIERIQRALAEASAAEQAAARMEGFNGEMKKLSSAFGELKIAIGKSGLLEAMTTIVTKIAEATARLAEADPVILKWGTAIAGVFAVGGPLLVGIGLFVQALGTIGPALAVVGKAIVTLVAASGPIGLLLTALAGVATIIYTEWDNIGPVVTGLFNSLTASVSSFATSVVETFAAIPGQMMEIGRQIVAGLWQGIQAEWEGFKANVKGYAGAIGGWLRDTLAIRSPSRVMAEIGKNVVQGLDVGMKEELPAVQSTAEDIGSTIGDAFMSVVDGSKSVKEAIKDVIASFAKLALQQINFGGLFGGSAAGGGGGGGGFLGGLLNSIFGNLPGFANGGSFTVGGAGGIDSQVAMMRLTPGEQVDIHKKGATRETGGTIANLNVTVSGARGNMEVQSMVQAGVAQAIGEYDRGLLSRIRGRETRGTRG